MNETDMEYVYMLIKDQPNVQEGYEMAKKERSKRKNHV